MKYVTERNCKMRILVDTNILFSALVFPGSKPAKALLLVADIMRWFYVTGILWSYGPFWSESTEIFVRCGSFVGGNVL